MNLAVPLSDATYVDLYALRREASTMTQQAIAWFQNNTTPLLERDRFPDDRTFSVLSVGCGSGEIDIEIIRSLLNVVSSSSSLPTSWKRLRYVGLEPNEIHQKQFIQLLGNTNLKHAELLDFHILNQTFDNHSPPQDHLYDLVLFVHVFYYFSQPLRVIQRAWDMCRAPGKLVVVHQTASGIPQIQQMYMRTLKGNEDGAYTTEDVGRVLKMLSANYRYEQLDAFLDISECIRGTETGCSIMSFCMECDLRTLEKHRLAELTNAFRELAVIRKDGSLVIPEPIGIFTVDTPPHCVRNLSDDDPVEDYHLLAQRINWTSFFSRHSAQRWRVLDVACGGGRWLDSFNLYVARSGGLDAQDLLIDVVDPCHEAILKISEKSEKLAPPLRLGAKHVSTIQKAQLDDCTYDVLWSVHGFYAIPKTELIPVLQKCFAVLKSNGVGFIALSTRLSFYIMMHEEYQKCVSKDGDGHLSSAEDVTNALCSLGVKHHVQSIWYEECIDVEDKARLTAYIIDECMVNCFAKDKDLKEFALRRELALEDILRHEAMRNFLQSFVRGSEYRFPQEVHVISFGEIEP